MIRRFAPALLALSIASACSAEIVTFKTRDGESLVGDFRAPAAGRKTIILMHGLAANRKEWAPLTAVLAKAGWGYLAFDLRGHGDSSTRRAPDGDAVGYRYFGPAGPGSPWEKMVDDVGAAMRFLENEKKIAPGSIAVGGASLGANAAIVYVELTRSVPAVLLLSPGLDYQGLKPEKGAARLSSPVLMVASAADRYAFGSCQRLKTLIPSATFWSDVKAGHGAQMFDEALLRRILAWLDAAT